jgi:prepilin-type N-terminal cleavage/methylation domain-containing protein
LKSFLKQSEAGGLMLMSKLLRDSRAFTVAELLVTLSIMALLMSVALPKFSKMRGQMRASEDVRDLADAIATLRSEAIRLRTTVKVTFTATGYTWDIGNDGSTEGSRLLGTSSTWNGGTPAAIILNGLGLARGIANQQSISIKNRGYITTLTINRNGHVKT